MIRELKISRKFTENLPRINLEMKIFTLEVTAKALFKLLQIVFKSFIESSIESSTKAFVNHFLPKDFFTMIRLRFFY